MNMRKLAVGAALAAVATAAMAIVTFDSTTGIGFVGKGDVQTPFGWNNAKAQQYSTQVSFIYNAVNTYDVECEWTTTTGGPNPKDILHDITIPRHTSVNASIASDPRKTGQWTGWNLTGLGSTTYDGTVPEVGGSCPGQGEGQVPGTVTAVTMTGSTGGLYATWNGTSILLQ
jgi:hypothetical protein